MDSVAVRRLRFLVVVFVLVASACSGGSASDVSPAVQGFLDRLGDDLPVSQAAALEDGVITFEEYEAAYERTVACMREQGLTVIGPVDVNRGRFLGYSYQAGPSVGDVDDACRREYLDLVDGLWGAQAMPSEAEAEVMARDYAACLRAAGVVIEGEPSLEEVDYIALEAAPGPNGDAVGKCSEQYSLGIFISEG